MERLEMKGEAMKKFYLCLSIGLFFVLTSGCKATDVKGGVHDAAGGEDACSGEACSRSSSRVSLIVFVGMDQACQCTRERIEKSWKALQEALGSRSDVQVKRIQWDVDEEEAEKYSAMKPIVTVPGIYFLDGDGRLVELLQGEVESRRIADLLK
jgi:hypothetical protein